MERLESLDPVASIALVVKVLPEAIAGPIVCLVDTRVNELTTIGEKDCPGKHDVSVARRENDAFLLSKNPLPVDETEFGVAVASQLDHLLRSERLPTIPPTCGIHRLPHRVKLQTAEVCRLNVGHDLPAFRDQLWHNLLARERSPTLQEPLRISEELGEILVRDDVEIDQMNDGLGRGRHGVHLCPRLESGDFLGLKGLSVFIATKHNTINIQFCQFTPVILIHSC